MNDRLNTYRQRFAAEQPDDGDPYREIADRLYRRDHPLDILTDRVWSAMIRTACFLGKFITAAAIGIILGRLLT